jgi:lysophospholipase L1-like esterase
MKSRWIVATAGLVLAAACGSSPNRPDPPPAASAPQIACPLDVTVKGVTGSSQEVTYTAPAVTGGTAPVNVSCTQTSGASFPLGVTPVTCTASDAMARQAACSFNVSLTGFAIAVVKFEVVGDSLSEGENGLPLTFIDGANSYPTKLQALFDAAYPAQVTVVNRGHSGDLIEKTRDDLRGLLLADRPGAVLVLGGYNNLTSPCSPGLAGTAGCGRAMTAVEFGIRDCIREAKESPVGIKYVFVSTLTPPGPVEPKPRKDLRIDNAAINEVNARIKLRVAQEGVTLVDTYPLFSGHEAQYVSIDGLHLQPAGYQAIADAFFAAIKATVPQTPLFTINGPR